MTLKLKRRETGGCGNVCYQVFGSLSQTFFLLMILFVDILDLLNGVPSKLNDKNMPATP
jgi:hypothetical protein